jgi:hypothetical protein
MNNNKEVGGNKDALSSNYEVHLDVTNLNKTKGTR